MKKISKSQHLQLVGLLTLAAHHNKALYDIEVAASEITGDEPRSGSHTGDATYADAPPLLALATLYRNLDITVSED